MNWPFEWVRDLVNAIPLKTTSSPRRGHIPDQLKLSTLPRKTEECRVLRKHAYSMRTDLLLLCDSGLIRIQSSVVERLMTRCLQSVSLKAYHWNESCPRWYSILFASWESACWWLTGLDLSWVATVRNITGLRTLLADDVGLDYNRLVIIFDVYRMASLAFPSCWASPEYLDRSSSCWTTMSLT